MQASQACVQQAVELWWPKDITEKPPKSRVPEFNEAMRNMQIDLILCRMPSMGPDDLRRAHDTLDKLEKLEGRYGRG